MSARFSEFNACCRSNKDGTICMDQRLFTRYKDCNSNSRRAGFSKYVLLHQATVD